MAEIIHSVQCICGSFDLEMVKKESITEKHLTDHIITYRCRECGKTKVLGVSNDQQKI